MNIGKHSAEIAAVSLILTIVIFWFGIKPMIGKLHQANLDLKVAEKEYAQKQERVEMLSKMQSRLSSIKSDLELMVKALPKGEDLPDLLVSTESLVGSSGLALSSFSLPTSGGSEKTPSPAETSEGGAEGGSAVTPKISPTVTQATGVTSASYSLSLQGSYSSFKTFLQNVEKNLRPTSVTSINISKSGNGMSFNVNLVSFYQQ